MKPYKAAKKFGSPYGAAPVSSNKTAKPAVQFKVPTSNFVYDAQYVVGDVIDISLDIKVDPNAAYQSIIASAYGLSYSVTPTGPDEYTKFAEYYGLTKDEVSALVGGNDGGLSFEDLADVLEAAPIPHTDRETEQRVKDAEVIKGEVQRRVKDKTGAEVLTTGVAYIGGLWIKCDGNATITYSPCDCPTCKTAVDAAKSLDAL